MRGAPGSDPPRDGPGAGLLLLGGLAHLVKQVGQIGVGLTKQILAAHLGTHRFLKKF